MKFSVLTGAMTLLASLNLWAAPATTYVCAGNNLTTNEAVAFDLTFSDWGPDTSYTNESIMVTRVGAETLKNPILFQMKGATVSNNCQVNEFGEIFMHGGFDMVPSEDSEVSAYKVTFSTKCSSAKAFDVKAYCFFE